jgi:hypothetical protein
MHAIVEATATKAAKRYVFLIMKLFDNYSSVRLLPIINDLDRWIPYFSPSRHCNALVEQFICSNASLLHYRFTVACYLFNFVNT